jgi:beta-lactamase superfamily II metal-dependent hydrolase
MRKIISRPLLIIFMILMLFMAGCGNSAEHKTPVTNDNAQVTPTPQTSTRTTGASGKLIVHFINVGQSDSELIQLPNGRNMLIDAGTNEAGLTVVSYLKNLGIKKIDYLVGTHPHEDHIGGMDNVIQSFKIANIYMPKVTTTTESFEDVLNSVKAKGLKINIGKAGMTIFNRNGLKIGFLAPCGTSYEDLNNWSIVTRVQFGNNSFLFTGDAQEQSENEILSSGADMKADVLKVGHHGSHSSTSASFLQAVAPRYAVISVGAGNDYGHPHQVTLDKLAAAGIMVYRTDQNGTVVITSDGKNLSVKALAGSIQPRAPNAVVNSANSASNSGGYIGNINSKKFHLPSCKSLPQPQNRVYFNSRDEALSQGYSPCGNCRP